MFDTVHKPTSRRHKPSSRKIVAGSSTGEKLSKKSHTHKKKKKHKRRPHRPEPGADVSSSSPEQGVDGLSDNNAECEFETLKISGLSQCSSEGDASSQTAHAYNSSDLKSSLRADVQSKPIVDKLSLHKAISHPPGASSTVGQRYFNTSSLHGVNGPTVSKTRKTAASCQKRNESLRWDYAVSDSDEEAERIRIYKMNRRKRYLAASNKTQASWIFSSSSSSFSSA